MSVILSKNNHYRPRRQLHCVKDIFSDQSALVELGSGSYSFNGPNNPTGPPNVYQPVYPFHSPSIQAQQAQQGIQQQQQQQAPLHGGQPPYAALNPFNSPYNTPPSFQPQQYAPNPYSHPHYHPQQPQHPPAFYPPTYPPHPPQLYPLPPHFYGIPPNQPPPVPYQLQPTAPRFYPERSNPVLPRPPLPSANTGSNITARPFTNNVPVMSFSQPQTPVNHDVQQYPSTRIANPPAAPAVVAPPRVHEPVLPPKSTSSRGTPPVVRHNLPETAPPEVTSSSADEPSSPDQPPSPGPQLLSPLRSPTSPSSSVGTVFSPSSTAVRYHILSYHPTIAIHSGDASVSLFISQLSSPPAHIRHAAVPLPERQPPRSVKTQKSTGAFPRKTKTMPSSSATGRYVGPAPAPAMSQSENRNNDRTPTSEKPSVKEVPDAHSTGSTTTPATSITDAPTPGSPLSSNTSTSSAPHQERTLTHADEDSETTTHVATPALADDAAAEAKKTTKPAPLTKSFASLLRSSTPSGRPASSAHPTGSSTPTDDVTDPGYPTAIRSAILPSAQIGFSVPAMSAENKENSVAATLSPRQHASLLKLLKTGAGLPASTPNPSSNSTSKAAASSNSIQIVPRGLVNTGNLCFANAILQALIYTPPFWRLFDELGKSGLRTDSTAGKDTPMIDAIVAFLNEFKPKVGPGPIDAASFPTASASASLPSGPSTSSSKPSSSNSRDPTLLPRNSFTASHLYNSLKSNSRFDAMRSGQQEDAEEFLGFYLDGLHEELCALLGLLGDSSDGPDAAAHAHDGAWEGSESGAGLEAAAGSGQDDGWQEIGKKNRAMVTRTMKSSESAITAIFGGKFRSILRASGRPDSASVEEWRCLQLDIQPQHVRTIEDALHALSTIETVSIQNRHGISTEATKQMFVEQLPPILVLHLKRFVYDPVTGIGKNGKAVKYGPELEIRSDLMSPSLKRGKMPVRYRLYGVVYHHGLAASGGHYTLDVLHPGPIPSSTDSKDATPKPNFSATSSTPSTPTSSQQGETWVRFDDESVRRLTREDVFGHPGSGVNSPSSRRGEREDRVAYLLLYRRIGR